MTFSPSRYQAAIFEWIDSGNGHAVVDAVPGSGKTTTLLEASKLLPVNVKALFCAFNAHIAKELGEKLKANGSSMECSTIHSLGKRILGNGNLRIDDKKYRDVCKTALLPYMSELTQSGTSFSGLVDQLRKLVDFARLTLTAPTEQNLLALISHYDLDVDAGDVAWRYLWPLVQGCIDEGKSLYRAGVIDFTDMIYLPTACDLACPQYDWLFVDEAQDLNAAQLALLLRCCSRGRMIFVGDKRQSLYGFAGADTRSIDNIIERTRATVLPLSICYRCPPNVVALAAQVYPGIEASDKAEGKIDIVAPDRFAATVKPGDLVLCRVTAPLVSECLRLLRAGVKAQVRGKDIGKSFVDLVKRLSMRMGFALENLSRLVEDHRREQLNILARVPDNEMKVAQLNDKVDTFVALLEAYLNRAGGQGSISGFETYIESFFTDDLGNGSKPVMFSTIHKAKGLEYDRVFILEPDKIPHPMAKKQWQREQEYNIEYVGITRAIQELYFVGGLIAGLSLAGQQDKHEPGAFDIGADCERGRHVDCMRRNCKCECHKPAEPRKVTLQLPEPQSIMTENAAPQTWVEAPKAHTFIKERRTLRKHVDDPQKQGVGRKPKGKAPRVTLQLSVDLEVYERVMQLKQQGEIESASALFEELFKARY